MKFHKQNRKKNRDVLYSCVVDDSSKFYWQGMIFVLSLIKLAKIEPKKIFIHMTGRNSHFENFLKEKGVNKVSIKPWGDKTYCNKLQQMETIELQKADYVFLCDADIAIVDNFEKIIDFNKVTGKTVDINNPDITQLKKIFEKFNLEFPKINTDTLNKQETFDGNFNGGLYGLPGRIIKKFGNRWKRWANKLLLSSECINILDDRRIHIDQISFCMTLKELELPYHKLDISYNFPTHSVLVKSNLDLISNEVMVMHYHSKLTTIGLLENTGIDVVDKRINLVNKVLKENFNNELFWDFRYENSPSLESGIGSRGEAAIYKLKLLKNIGIENDLTVLDVGCGDVEITRKLNIKNYIGLDISYKALIQARNKIPNGKFYSLNEYKNESNKIDTVLCLDVLIHQSSREDYDNLIGYLSDITDKRLIVSGYRCSVDNSPMCFFYEDLVCSLKNTNKFKYIYKIGTYRGLDVIVADRGDLGRRKDDYPNDINNDEIDHFIDSYKEIDSELLLAIITVSRGLFGWYTKHLPRLYEYPWFLSQLNQSLKDKTIVDFGAGITPLPIILNFRGANVVTIDNHKIRRSLSNVNVANEWGFFDYSQMASGIKSYNENINGSMFSTDDVDIWYSISVIEHLPANSRKEALAFMYNTLKKGGRLLLTVDLEKNSNKLWNRSSGEQIEDPDEHGTLESMIYELQRLGFVNIDANCISMPETERVDIATIRAEADK